MKRAIGSWQAGTVTVALALGVSVAGCHGAKTASAPAVTSATAVTSVTAADPLPSWSDGATKRAVLDFVLRATSDGPEAVPAAERIATFDNDGTLWQEMPVAEGAFVMARLETMAGSDPSLREKQPFKAALAHDMATLHEEGEKAILELFLATHAGMTDEVYASEVRSFLATARHPRFDAPYTALVYQPMLELMALLRGRGFVTYISSGGETDFMRTFSSSVYRIPPEHVIGSRLAKELTVVGGKTTLLRRPKIEALNDKEAKPVGIDREIGRRPVFAAGNVRSGGDIAMLRYAKDRAGPSFALVVNHDDPEREFAYAEKDGATLAAADTYGFTVVSMKRDWNVVFPSTMRR